MLCGAMIDRVALDALVLKARFPELQLREGRAWSPAWPAARRPTE